MFTLFVSYDCGVHYSPKYSAEALDELCPRMAKLNEDMLRWYLEKDGKDFFGETCAIHKSIVQFMQHA